MVLGVTLVCYLVFSTYWCGLLSNQTPTEEGIVVLYAVPNGHLPCAFSLLYLQNLTFVELDPEVIISSLHQPIRLKKMHILNYWSRLWADRKLEAARTGCAVGLMALAVWQLCFIDVVKVQFRRYIHFYVLLHNANPKMVFSHIYFCYCGKSSRRELTE